MTAVESTPSKLLDLVAIRDTQEAIDLVANILDASTEYSIIGKDLDGTIVLWNEGARRLYGYQPEEVVGKANASILHSPEDTAAGRPREYLEAAQQTGKWEGTIERVRKSGERFPARVVITPRRDGSGKSIGYLLISKDVSDEMRLNEELKDNQYYTRSLIESNIDALMTTDPLGIITDVNQQMEALTGRTRNELIGTPFKGYFTNPQRAEEGIRLVLREGKVTNYELTVRGRGGRETVVSYNAATFYDRDDKLQGVFAAARDVTERKRFEFALQEKNVELEGASLAKDRFLASMSHELRTPLNAIIGFTGTLLMKLPGPLTADQEKQLRTVQASAKYLLSLINDLLDLAKIESGKVELHLEPVVFQKVMQDVASTLRPLAEAKELTLEIEAPDEEVAVATDQRALSQIVINLTNNAIKFTEHGSVRLVLRQRAENGQAQYELSVADTGIGIKDEDQRQLFEAFSQVNADNARRREGTGLGLHLSQKLAGMLGGRITLDSAYEKGSTFTLILPQSRKVGLDGSVHPHR